MGEFLSSTPGPESCRDLRVGFSARSPFLPRSASPTPRARNASCTPVDGKSPITVSGALFIPKGTPPQEGWPLLAWAHGTVGIADICAPSWQARSYRDVRY